MAEFDHLLAERDPFARKIESCMPIETATALALADWIILAGAAMSKLTNLPASNGYEPYFIEAGAEPTAARGLANLATKHGKRIAREARRYEQVTDAIRFLAKVRQKGATAKRARAILEAWRETSIVETLFYSAGLEEFELIRLLQGAG